MSVTFANLSKLDVQVGMLCKDSSGNQWRVIETSEDFVKFAGAGTTTGLKKHNAKLDSGTVPIVEPELTDPTTLGMVIEQAALESKGGYVLCPDVDSSTGGWIAIWDLESYDGDLSLTPSVAVQGTPWAWKPLWAAGITPPTYQFATRVAAVEAWVSDVLQ